MFYKAKREEITKWFNPPLLIRQILSHFSLLPRLYDRVGKPRIVHDERYSVPRIPAIVELCIQAGIELEKLPTRRRMKPVYSIEGRIVDFESVTEKDGVGRRNLYLKNVDTVLDSKFGTNTEMAKNSVSENAKNLLDQSNDEEGENLRDLSIFYS
jgi:hypothetical protein